MLLEWRGYDRSQDEKSRANNAAVGVGDTREVGLRNNAHQGDDMSPDFLLRSFHFVESSRVESVESSRVETKDRLRTERNPDPLAVRR